MIIQKNRNVLLDATKGFAIILMVFGHAVEDYTIPRSAATDIWYWAAIHHFHMALFVFISGYLVYGRMNSGWMTRRSLQLTLPFILWSLILYYWSFFSFSGLSEIYPLRDGLIKNLLYSAWSLNPSGLWFLPLILGLCLLIYLSRGKVWILLGIAILAYIIDQTTSSLSKLGLPDTYWLAKIAWFMPFFIGGYMIAQYRDKLMKLSLIKWAALVAFPVFFVVGGDLNYSPFIYSWPDYTVFLNFDIISIFYTFWMAVLGITMSFAIVEIIMKITAFRRALSYLGTISLGIYCVHSMWRFTGLGNGIIATILSTLLALVLSLVLIWGLQRFRITNHLLLGHFERQTPINLEFVKGLFLRNNKDTVSTPD